MRKQTLFLSIALAVVSHCTFSQDKTDLFLNDTYWPPYLFPASDTEFLGVAKETLNYCLKDSNYDLKYLNLPIKRTHYYMSNGGLDITIYSHKKSREDFLYYGKVPIFSVNYGFVAAKNRNFKITRISDLKPLVVGHLSGLSHTPEVLSIIEEKKPLQTVVESNNLIYMMQQLASSPPRIDIIPNATTTFLWQIKRLGLEDKLTVLDYVVDRKQYYVTVSKASKNIPDSQTFLAKMDQCLIDYKQTTEYQLMLSKYGLSPTS